MTEYFETDHRRLDKIYDRFQDEYKAGDWEAAVSDFRAFRLGLKRHIKAEEEILFPTFEDKTGMKDAGPTFVMRMEHKDIQDYLDRVLEGAEARDAGRTKDAAYLLTNILSDHNMKEEHILYPESDSFLEGPERASVVKKAQAI
ncbi:MAG: hemerythrin domain-containing protein [Deltaproteobacteria bacterium]|nr:hemerythrin domain-containing protein [Deltaproteobacteria bacterium]